MTVVGGRQAAKSRLRFYSLVSHGGCLPSLHVPATVRPGSKKSADVLLVGQPPLHRHPPRKRGSMADSHGGVCRRSSSAPPVAGLVSPLLSHDSPVRPGSKKSAEVLLAGQPWECLPSLHVRTPGGRIGVASFESRLPSQAGLLPWSSNISSRPCADSRKPPFSSLAPSSLSPSSLPPVVRSCNLSVS